MKLNCKKKPLTKAKYRNSFCVSIQLWNTTEILENDKQTRRFEFFQDAPTVPISQLPKAKWLYSLYSLSSEANVGLSSLSLRRQTVLVKICTAKILNML